MIIAFFIIFAIATIGLDFMAWRRIDTEHRTARVAVGVVLLILNALPFITPLQSTENMNNPAIEPMIAPMSLLLIVKYGM